MKNTFLAIAALATLFSCSSIDEIAGDKYAAGDYVESVEMTVEDFEEDATTRTALSNLSDSGAKFAWAENDTVGIFPNVGDQVSFSMAAGAGTSSATFNGGGWALRTSSTYSAYYPFSKWNIFRDSKSIAINMVSQTQNGNDDTSEIGTFDIMAAAPASAETGNVKFAFKHQVSICRIKLTLPENKSFKSV
ncbi:MAG: fimbrillin family protein, partial [Bacteroidales bacterium]|nr:fimbrillin family protein [Bacteroidales bacterium]